MTAIGSLRSRVLIGAALWTTGLVAVFGIVLTALMLQHPRAPRIVHGIFAHSGLVALAAAGFLSFGLWQVRKGFTSFHDLRTRLAEVRAGRTRHVEGQYPEEVQPLVDDLNALLDHRERVVTRALAKAGDLAHGLKTPLAILSQEAERTRSAGEMDIASTIVQQVERMRRQVDYHLAHARAVASGSTPGARCDLKPAVDALCRTVDRLYASKSLAIEVHVGDGHAVRAERRDVEEMLGNLLDNACKWGSARVTVTSSVSDTDVTIAIDDDGPGIEPSQRGLVLQRGVRADEAAPGSGLGLAIVRDLAELYGGSIALDASPMGGVQARLTLPR